MVWILAPNHPSLGVSKYSLTSPGTYKIGRKDCAIIIQTDKTVSRLHAEIVVDPVEHKNDSADVHTLSKPKIVLKDLSKFGSFVNRVGGSKPVFSLPNKEKELKEGDIVTFGTDSSSFKLEYFAFRPHIAPLADENRRQAIVDIVTSAGGYAVDKWCSDCTHLIVEDGSTATNTVIQAVADKKPVIGIAWIEAISARSSLSSEFASCSRFTPNLQWKINSDGKFLKIIEPEARSLAFNGLTFYVGSNYLYNNKDLLQLLVEASGGSVRAVTEVSRSRFPRGSQKSNEILILPDLEPKLQRWMSPEEAGSISHIRRTSEEKFIAAVLTGEFKEEYFENPASPAASASTDETVEASNSGRSHEDEISSANQVDEQPLFVGKRTKSEVLSHGSRRTTSNEYSAEKTPQSRASRAQQDGLRAGLLQSSVKHKHGPSLAAEQEPLSVEQFKGVQKPSVSASTSYSQAISEGVTAVNAHESSRITIEDLGDATAAIEFRKDLVVRSNLDLLEKNCSSDLSMRNFKRFKKKPDSSGNSFASLVPFAKEPYRESDFNKDVQDYMLQEKKRKQAEALAEDLFNAEQLKRKKGVGAQLVTALREGRLKVK